MSRENVDLVRDMCEAFLAGNLLGSLETLHPDVVWHGTIGGLDEMRTAHGHHEVIEGFAESIRDWERHSLEVERYIDAGARVVVFWHENGRGKASGVEVRNHFCQLWTISEGVPARMHEYATSEEAFAATSRR